MAKARRERTKVDVNEPIPIGPVAPTAEDDVEPRAPHNPSGRGTRSHGRKRKGSTEPILMSNLHRAEAAACFGPLWDLAEVIDAEVRAHRHLGRPLKTSAFEVLLEEVLTWELRSYRAVDRELGDPANWRRLRRAVKRAWPDHPNRRLPRRPPTRSRCAYFRRRYFTDDVVAQVRTHTRDAACAIAINNGQFDPSDGSVSQPSRSRVAAGDMTWVQARYNGTTDDLVDKETGVILSRRVDPDAIHYHDKAQSAGRSLLSIDAPSPYPNERLVLDFEFKPLDGTTESELAAQMTLLLQSLLPGMQSAVYDMGLNAESQDHLMDHGIFCITKVPRDSRGRPARGPLGLCDFHLKGGATKAIAVNTYDGWPYIDVPDPTGQPKGLRLKPGRIYWRGRPGKKRLYEDWSIPDEPEIPRSLRHATVRLRHNSTDQERAENRLRPRHLKPAPEGSAVFEHIFGRREDIESMHNHFKERMGEKRARCVGLRRQRLNFHGYQLRTCTTALIAWHLRTGGDLTPWFGRWRPPERALHRAA